MILGRDDWMMQSKIVIQNHDLMKEPKPTGFRLGYFFWHLIGSFNDLNSWKVLLKSLWSICKGAVIVKATDDIPIQYINFVLHPVGLIFPTGWKSGRVYPTAQADYRRYSSPPEADSWLVLRTPRKLSCYWPCGSTVILFWTCFKSTVNICWCDVLCLNNRCLLS